MYIRLRHTLMWKQDWTIQRHRQHWVQDREREKLIIQHRTLKVLATWVIRIRISQKDKQNNGQKKRDKRTNNNLQNTTQKTKDRAARTPIKSVGDLRCSGRESSSCSNTGTRRVILLTTPQLTKSCRRT